MKPKSDHDQVATWARQSELPVTEEHITSLVEGYRQLQQLRAMLHRPGCLSTDLAPVFLPEFDR
jgi:hypothetical protein